MRFAPSVAGLASVLLVASAAHAQDGPAPPPPMDPNQPGAPGAPAGGAATPEQQTEQDLNKAEQEDNGRKFELFWIDGSIGGSYINMTGLNDSTLKIEKSSAGGPAFDLGAGVRFVVLVLGARIKYNALSAFNMWQLDGQAGFKFPVSNFDILFTAHGGYSFVGSLGNAAVATDPNTPSPADKVKVRGLNAGIDLGFDYYVSPMFSVGVGAFADLLFLNRPPAPIPDVSGLPADQQAAAKAQIQSNPLYQQSGSSVGLELGGGLRLGLHFGL